MKMFVVMISAPEPPQQQMHMHDEALEAWFVENDADDRVTELMNARTDERHGRYYWVDEVPLRVKDEPEEV